METENLAELYDKNFKPEAYLDMFFKTIDNEPDIQWTIEETARVFSGSGHVGAGAAQGVDKSVIEVSTGPTPFNSGPIAKWANNIVWTDFTRANREYLWRWLGQEGATPAFESFFKFAADIDKESADRQAERLRQKVTGVMYVDVHQENPLTPLDIQADVVFSHLVLEYVVSSRDLYKKLFKNCTTLIKPGGFLVLQSATGASSYFVEDVKFPATNVDEAFLVECVAEAGLELVEYKEYRSSTGGVEYGQQETGDKNTDHNGMYSLVAKKPNKAN